MPAGGTGSVDVLDVETGTFHVVDGWKTAEREGHGGTRLVGRLGRHRRRVRVRRNRAVNEVCAVDLTTLVNGACLSLPGKVDGVAAVRGARQVWVTTPDDGSVTVLDALPEGGLKLAGSVKVGGEPEGYAVDDLHGVSSRTSRTRRAPWPST